MSSCQLWCRDVNSWCQLWCRSWWWWWCHHVYCDVLISVMMLVVMSVMMPIAISSCQLSCCNVSCDVDRDFGCDVILSIVISWHQLWCGGDVSSDVGCDVIICFTYLCHNPSNFLAASTLSTSWHRITTAALMSVVIERILYEATQPHHFPFVGLWIICWQCIYTKVLCPVYHTLMIGEANDSAVFTTLYNAANDTATFTTLYMLTFRPCQASS